MLPFLKHKKVAGLIIQHRKPDDVEPKESQENPAVIACAQDLLDAVQAQDVSKVASAMRAAFEIFDAQPHVEGEHIEE